MTKYTLWYHFVSAYFVRNELREDEEKKSIHESFGGKTLRTLILEGLSAFALTMYTQLLLCTVSTSPSTVPPQWRLFPFQWELSCCWGSFVGNCRSARQRPGLRRLRCVALMFRRSENYHGFDLLMKSVKSHEVSVVGSLKLVSNQNQPSIQKIPWGSPSFDVRCGLCGGCVVKHRPLGEVYHGIQMPWPQDCRRSCSMNLTFVFLQTRTSRRFTSSKHICFQWSWLPPSWSYWSWKAVMLSMASELFRLVSVLVMLQACCCYPSLSLW